MLNRPERSVLNLSNLAAPGESQMGSTLLFSSNGLRCHLGFYREGSAQGMHSHATPTVSVLLSGTVHERVDSREISASASSISIKPAGIRHSDLYGRNGALILSVAVDDPEHWAAAVPSAEWAWRPLLKRDYHSLIASLNSSSSALCDASFELLAFGANASQRRGEPPCWLRGVKEHLCDSPDAMLGNLAAEADVHPVYLARAFRDWYGISPSTFRLVQRTSAAIGATLWGNKAASAVAHEVGFADQSHMARSIRAATGHSLSELRLLAARSLATGRP